MSAAHATSAARMTRMSRECTEIGAWHGCPYFPRTAVNWALVPAPRRGQVRGQVRGPIRAHRVSRPPRGPGGAAADGSAPPGSAFASASRAPGRWSGPRIGGPTQPASLRSTPLRRAPRPRAPAAAGGGCAARKRCIGQGAQHTACSAWHSAHRTRRLARGTRRPAREAQPAAHGTPLAAHRATRVAPGESRSALRAPLPAPRAAPRTPISNSPKTRDTRARHEFPKPGTPVPGTSFQKGSRGRRAGRGWRIQMEPCGSSARED